MADEQQVSWPRLDSVARHLGLAEEHVAKAAAEDFSIGCWQELTEGVGARFESPLQAIFWIWFKAILRADEYEFLFADWDRPDLSPERDVQCSSGERYRLDFTLIFDDPELHLLADEVGFPDLKVAVELDGHEFHERTPEQVALRNRRDHDLMADGWKVIHFSGREIHRDPRDCARRVVSTYMRELSPWVDALIKSARDRKIEPSKHLPERLRREIVGA